MRVVKSCTFFLSRNRWGPSKEYVFLRQQSSLPAAEGVSSSAECASKERELEAEHNQLSSSVNLDGAQVPDRHVYSIRRTWKRVLSGSDSMAQERFTITSFNILASEHAQKHRHLYSSLHSSHLTWSRRRARIMQGLNACSPDIICLQEVDKFEDLEEVLALKGFIGLYKRRTGETTDGCAIFWKKARFQLLQERSFEFAMLDMRNNVAQLCVLELIETEQASNPIWSRSDDHVEGRCLVVGNIHVLYNPKRGDIKLGQCRAFLEQVHNMSSIWNGAPVVIGGDFNSTPSSAIYKYLATSELELANLDRKYVSGILNENIDPFEQNQGKSVQQVKDTVWNAVGQGSLQAVLNVSTKSSDDFPAAPALKLSDAVFSCSSESILTASTTEYCGFVQDRPGWDVEELRIATGKNNCTLVRHELNLSSAYSDIQGGEDTRDAQGEPLLTTCHNKFLGTVDYIWRNDGLKTLGVLDTLPLKCFAGTKGLPVKVWGSDHLPLACELAFAY